jgi:hypothetical protein
VQSRAGTPSSSQNAASRASSASLSAVNRLIATTSGTPKALQVVDMPPEVGQPGLQGGDVFSFQVSFRNAAVVLERPHRGHQHGGRRAQAGLAALDVEELLRAQVRAEARLGHHVIGKLERRARGDYRVAAMRDIGEGAAVHQRRRVLQGLHQVGLQRIAQQCGHGAGRAEFAGTDLPAIPGVADHDVGQSLLQVLQVVGQAENRHHLRGHGDIKARLSRDAVPRPAKPGDHVPQRTIVHIDDPSPGAPAHVEVQRVAPVQVVVEHGCQQIVRGADRVQVAGEMQVDVLHGQHLRVAATGGTALHAEYRAQAGLAETHETLLPMCRIPSARPTEVAVLPSPMGVGDMAVTRISLPSPSPAASQNSWLSLALELP